MTDNSSRAHQPRRAKLTTTDIETVVSNDTGTLVLVTATGTSTSVQQLVDDWNSAVDADGGGNTYEKGQKTTFRVIGPGKFKVRGKRSGSNNPDIIIEDSNGSQLGKTAWGTQEADLEVDLPAGEQEISVKNTQGTIFYPAKCTYLGYPFKLLKTSGEVIQPGTVDLNSLAM